jgi:predicted metal-dependent phosphoesterase TrpH
VIGDLHIHSKYSFDSTMDPSKILKKCKKLGFDVVSITDHDSLKGSMEAKKYEKDINIKVIVGEEIKTDLGDIIGLNLNDEIKTRQFIEVIEEIKEQGGISVFPHPFRGHKNNEYIASKIDIIEVFNARSSFEENRKSFELVCELKKPYLAGSDAHLYTEIGNSIMYFDDLCGCNKIYSTSESKKSQKIQSHVIRDIRLQKYYKLPFHLLRLIF